MCPVLPVLVEEGGVSVAVMGFIVQSAPEKLGFTVIYADLKVYLYFKVNIFLCYGEPLEMLRSGSGLFFCVRTSAFSHTSPKEMQK